jgi:hypothetical protein
MSYANVCSRRIRERARAKENSVFHVHSAYNSFDWGEGVNENSPTCVRAI